MFDTRNDLPKDSRSAVIALLNQSLANLFDLYSQTKFAHWNVKGPTFYSLHKLFDELAGTVNEGVDEVAERITALGGVASGTARLAAKSSQLAEFPAETFEGNLVVKALADRYAAVAGTVRRGIETCEEAGDAVSADLLTGLCGELDKALYFIESHIQK